VLILGGERRPKKSLRLGVALAIDPDAGGGPVAIECPECDSRDDRECRGCGGDGRIIVERPRDLVGVEDWTSIRLACQWEAHGLPPVSGGYLDQAAAAVATFEFVWAEIAEHRRREVKRSRDRARR
jgi:hypothetical protein